MVRARRTIFAGFCGGLLAGVLDALPSLGNAEGILTLANRIHLVIIDASLGALAGAALALVFVGWALALRRLLGETPWRSGEHAVALLLASPLLVYDAFALFHGHRAARIPAHQLLSVALVLLGAAGIWGAVTVWAWLLPRAEVIGEGTATSAGKRVRLLGAGLALLIAALVAGRANRTILPRLYHWFHLSLSLVQLVLCILAARLFLAMGRRLLCKRWSWAVVAGAVVLLGVAGAVERPVLSHSQSLRFFIFEKTQLASLFARVLPTPGPDLAAAGATTAGAADLAAAKAALPPLPQAPPPHGSDVVLITIDAQRADLLGCYGYPRATSPNIDKLAARGVRFAHTYTQAPHTSFSLASVMIGKYYATLARLARSQGHETIAKVLRRYGWKTAAFFPPAVFYIDAEKMQAFESTYFDFEYVKYEYLDAQARVGQIARFLDSEHPKKLFLWLHLFEPHEPYVSHPGFDFGPRDIDRYDSEIAYADEAVGKVVALLQRKRPGAIIILAADHGEEFGEHGGRYHGTTLFEEQEHVPLIVVAPGLVPHVVTGPTQLIDIPATILGLLDIPQSARMLGTDLGPWLASPPAPSSRLPPVFAEVEDKRMVVSGTHKLICNISKDYCSLFDLKADPGEHHDLADQQPHEVAALRRTLDGWLSEQARYEGQLVGAAGGKGDLARAIERARLGEAGAAEPLAEKLLGTAPLSARREAASLIVTALPPRPETLPRLLAVASAARDDVIRDWAAVAATRLGSDRVSARMHAMLASEPTEDTATVRTYAALALAEHGDRTGVPVLCDALDSCDDDVLLCRRCLAALGKLGDTRAVAPLIAHLPYVRTRLETVKALSAIASDRSVPALIDRLETDEYVPVRAAAAQALGRIGGARAVQALGVAERHEGEPLVVTAVRKALLALGRKP